MFRHIARQGSRNKVFQDAELVASLQRQSGRRLQAFAEKYREGLTRLEEPSKNKCLGELANVLVKILLDCRVSLAELSRLSANENLLLLMVIKKKKLNGWQRPQISLEFVNRLNRGSVPRKPEENMKYVMKKAFRFLQRFFRYNFFQELICQLKKEFRVKDKIFEFEYAFFGFYFGEVAVRANQAIEKFFTPRNSSRKRFERANLVSKTMSRLYLSYLRMSEPFVRDLLYYFEHCLLPETRVKVREKVHKMCADWRRVVQKDGWSTLLEKVKFNFEHNPRTKVLWSLREVQLAREQVQAFLKEKI